MISDWLNNNNNKIATTTTTTTTKMAIKAVTTNTTNNKPKRRTRLWSDHPFQSEQPCRRQMGRIWAGSKGHHSGIYHARNESFTPLVKEPGRQHHCPDLHPASLSDRACAVRCIILRYCLGEFGSAKGPAKKRKKKRKKIRNLVLLTCRSLQCQQLNSKIAE